MTMNWKKQTNTGLDPLFKESRVFKENVLALN